MSWPELCVKNVLRENISTPIYVQLDKIYRSFRSKGLHCFAQRIVVLSYLILILNWSLEKSVNENPDSSKQKSVIKFAHCVNSYTSFGSIRTYCLLSIHPVSCIMDYSSRVLKIYFAIMHGTEPFSGLTHVLYIAALVMIFLPRTSSVIICYPVWYFAL